MANSVKISIEALDAVSLFVFLCCMCLFSLVSPLSSILPSLASFVQFPTFSLPFPEFRLISSLPSPSLSEPFH